MTGSCHTVPVKLGAPIRREGRDPQAMMSMLISPLCPQSPAKARRDAILYCVKREKARRRRRASTSLANDHGMSDRLQIAGGLLAALGYDFEADLLALVQRTQAGAFHCGDVYEHILRAIVRLNEAVALLR